ncbi:MAG TPA: Lrp/AsnC ligand binding domain-containing protein [Pseudomonadales bacterium]
MRPVFVQLRCVPGKTYEVADELFAREIASELYSTSGEYDLLLKIYIPDGVDIGKFINDNVANVPGIVRSLTTLTFTAFQARIRGYACLRSRIRTTRHGPARQHRAATRRPLGRARTILQRPRGTGR